MRKLTLNIFYTGITLAIICFLFILMKKWETHNSTEHLIENCSIYKLNNLLFLKRQKNVKDLSLVLRENDTFTSAPYKFPKYCEFAITPSSRYVVMSIGSKFYLFDTIQKCLLGRSLPNDCKSSLIAFAPNDDTLLFSRNGSPILWELPSCKEYSLRNNSNFINKVTSGSNLQFNFSQNSQWGYVLDHLLNQLIVWDVVQHKITKRITINASKTNLATQTSGLMLAACSSKRIVALCNGDANVQFWDTINNKLIFNFQNIAGECYSYAVSNDRNEIAIATGLNKTILLNTSNLSTLSLETHETIDIQSMIDSLKFPYEIQFNNTSTLLLTAANRTGGIQVWDVKTGKSLFKRNSPGYPTPVAFIDSGKKLIYIDQDNTRIINLYP